MHAVWTGAVGLLVGVLLVWLALAGVLLVAGRHYGAPRLREILRLLPDVLRLTKRLATDRSLPRGVRIRLWALLAYLALPVDLIPDFLPLIGYADDAIVVALALRSVARRAGIDAIIASWPGSELGLRTVLQATGLDKQKPGPARGPGA